MLGSGCNSFNGKVVGQTYTLTMKIETDKFYRLRLWRIESLSDGQWGRMAH